MDSGHDPLRKIPTKHVPEARADIGTALKAARTRKGHALEAVAQQTRIPKKFLDALENNRFDEFPALAYLRGFLKSYCDYLELDFEPLWKQITAEPAPAEEAPKAAAPAPAPAPAPVKPAPAPPKPEAKKKTKKEEAMTVPVPAHDAHHGHDAHHAPAAAHAGPSSPIGPILLALILCVLGSVGYFAAVSHAPTPPAVEAPGAQGFGKAPAENALTLELLDEAFVSVSIDGAQVFAAKVPKGAKQEWKSAKSIELKLSNPASVTATLNGSELKLPAPDASGAIRIEAR